MDPIGITGPIGPGNGDGDGDGDQSAEGRADASRNEENGAAGAAESNDHKPKRKQPAGKPRRKSSARKHCAPTRDELRLVLKRLPVLVATGALTTAQSKEIREIVKMLLDEMRPENPQAGSGGADTPQIREVLRQHPDLLHALEPLFSDDELRDLIDDEDDEEDEGDDQQDKKKS